MNSLENINLEENANENFIVQSAYTRDHLKRLILRPGKLQLKVPLSACVSKGDKVCLADGNAWVISRNGKAQFLQPYLNKEVLSVGEHHLEIVIKEITELEEYNACRSLAEFHYRNHSLHGRTARLIARAFHPMCPQVIGYIELATPFYMNKARARVLNAPFKLNGISWDSWNMPTMRQYIHLIVRIARCVVYPEFRGLGLGQSLVRHAVEFARSRWQIAGIMPYFIEISADMLKYVPFADKAGFYFIGETEGNLKRVYKDMEYLTRNAERVRSGEIVLEESCGIVDQQVARMERMLYLINREGVSREELLKRLHRLSKRTVLRDFALFHNIISLPKPTFLKGLYPESQAFLQERVSKIAPPNGHQPPSLKLEPISTPIKLMNITVAHVSRVQRTHRTHKVQQAFGISPDSIKDTVIRGLSIEINPGEVILIIGPSGSGKTSLLNILSSAQRKDQVTNINGDIEFPRNYHPGTFEEIRSNKALIEVLGNKDVNSSLFLMGLVGLSDAFIYLKRFHELSKGQQYRAMLALLISRGCNVWLVDEFCANLDYVTANVVAHKLQRTARRVGATLIVAAPHCQMFLHSLQPNKVIQLTTAWEHSVTDGKEFMQAMYQGLQWDGRLPSLRLTPKFLDAVRQGKKISTIRKGRLSIGPGLLLLQSDEELLGVRVVEIVYKRFCELTEEDAHNDGFETLESLQKGLLMFYPNLRKNSILTVIKFNLICNSRAS